MTAPPPRRALASIAWACLLIGGCASVPPSPPEAAVPDATPVVVAPVAPVALPAPAPAPAAAPAPAEPPPAAVAAAAAVEPEPAAPLRPRGRLDPEQDAQRHDLWQRIRDGMAMPDLDDELVRKWEQWYAKRPDYVQRMTERGARYLFHIVEEVERRRLPSELALLPFIESAFNPQAMSRAAASGMWQFMPATGRDFELRQNLFRDDRRDVLASTRAALDYLERLYARFGHWHLALAAYNWGQGNVQRAIDLNLRRRAPTDYGSLLRLPLETREYVPKLQAVKNLLSRPGAYGLVLPPLDNHPFFLGVKIERDIDAALAAQLSGLTLDEFGQLNPQHNKPVILAAGTPQVLLPYDNANRFIRSLDAHPGPLASWTAWVAPRTLKPAEAARLTGMTEAELRAVNRIPQGMLVRASSTLLVPRGAHAVDDVPGALADSARIVLTPEGRAMRQIAITAGRKGDSVAALARRYRVSAQALAQWNGVTPGAHFAPGQRIVVMLPAAPASPARAKPAPARSAHARPPAGGAPARASRPAR